MVQNPFQKQTSQNLSDMSQEIERTKVELNQVERNYNTYTDPHLLDYCIYEKLALQAKLNYLYNKAKVEEQSPVTAKKTVSFPTVFFDHRNAF